MGWTISEQAAKAYDTARSHDAPTREAMDRLWARIDLDPHDEGTPIVDADKSTEPQMRRLARALAGLANAPGALHRSAASARLSTEDVAGPSMPPARLVFAVHWPDFPRRDEHTLIALGVLDRQGRIR